MNDRNKIERLQTLASWLDSRFVIPGTQISFGLDALIGLIPGVGDTVTAAISLYMIQQAHSLGVPWHVKLRMVGNLAIDWLVGLIPLIGDVFDLTFKANMRNMRLIRTWLAQNKEG